MKLTVCREFVPENVDFMATNLAGPNLYGARPLFSATNLGRCLEG